MNRADLVETAEQAVAEELHMAAGWETPRSLAEAVLDAVLPLITTAEQLQAVTPDSWLVDRDGDGYQKVSDQTVTDGDGTPWTIEEMLKFGPLTVVWAA